MATWSSSSSTTPPSLPTSPAVSDCPQQQVPLLQAALSEQDTVVTALTHVVSRVSNVLAVAEAHQHLLRTYVQSLPLLDVTENDVNTVQATLTGDDVSVQVKLDSMQQRLRDVIDQQQSASLESEVRQLIKQLEDLLPVGTAGASSQSGQTRPPVILQPRMSSILVQPAVTATSPANNTSTISNTTVTPTCTPTNATVTPTNTTVTPTNTTDTPTNATITATYATVTPTNATVTPTNANVTPTNATVTATNANVTPTNATVTATNATITPTNTTVTPTNTTVTPTNTTVTPTNATVTPTNANVTPTNATVTPTNATITPTNTTVTPTNATVTPTNANVTPTNTTVTPTNTTVTPTNATVTATNATVGVDPMTSRPRRVFSVTAACDDDRGEPWIASIISTQDGHKLVMTDLKNFKVKVVDMRHPQVVSASLTLNEQLAGLASLPDGLIAVTADSFVIYLLTLTDTVTVTSRIQTGTQYYGVGGLSDGTLIVSCAKDDKCVARVDVIERSGDVVRTIIDTNTLAQLSAPYYLCVCDNHVFVSDFDSDSVYKVDISNGQVVDTITLPQIKYPRQVTVDRSGSVYIASSSGRCVLVRSAGGQWRKLVNSYQPGYDLPQGLCVTSCGSLVVAWMNTSYNSIVVVYDR